MANAFLSALSLYLLFGTLLAAVVVLLLGRLDRAARGAYSFRLLIVPGLILLWPWVVARLLALRMGRAS